MAVMKSTRNPLTKQLPASRRKKSDFQSSDEKNVTVSDLDVNPQTETVDDELSLSSDTQTSNEPILFSNSQVTSSYQSEFLKMLSQSNSLGMSVSLEGGPKRQKLSGSSAKKLESSVHTPAIQESAPRLSASQDFSFVVSNTSEVDIQQTVTEVLVVKTTENGISRSAESSSLDCSSEGVTHSDSRLVPSAATSASCETLSAQSSSCYVTQQSGVSTPVLSLPHPVSDTGSCVPLLEPSRCASSDHSSASVQAFSADVSITNSTCDQRTLTSTDTDVQNDKQGSAESSSTDCADTDVSVDSSTSPSVNCSTSVEASHGSALQRSTLAANTVNIQPSCTVNSSAAVSTPCSPSKFSALARFRPTLSANTLLPLVNSRSQLMRPGARHSSIGHSASFIRR